LKIFLNNPFIFIYSVEKGVALIKQDNYYDAILCFRQALQCDENNVEAFVARGALYANKGEFDKAIGDLERAVELDSAHTNAKRYLKEVFLAYSVK
jgi:tetratricopeptide (TPR) repeat protein